MRVIVSLLLWCCWKYAPIVTLAIHRAILVACIHESCPWNVSKLFESRTTISESGCCTLGLEFESIMLSLLLQWRRCWHREKPSSYHSVCKKNHKWVSNWLVSVVSMIGYCIGHLINDSVLSKLDTNSQQRKVVCRKCSYANNTCEVTGRPSVQSVHKCTNTANLHGG